MARMLAGGCRVWALKEGRPRRLGGLKIWDRAGRRSGAKAISFRVMELEAGLQLHHAERDGLGPRPAAGAVPDLQAAEPARPAFLEGPDATAAREHPRHRRAAGLCCGARGGPSVEDRKPD